MECTPVSQRNLCCWGFFSPQQKISNSFKMKLVADLIPNALCLTRKRFQQRFDLHPKATGDSTNCSNRPKSKKKRIPTLKKKKRNQNQKASCFLLLHQTYPAPRQIHRLLGLLLSEASNTLWKVMCHQECFSSLLFLDHTES